MARALSTILQSLINKLPSGFALGLRGGVLDAILEAVASQIETVERDAEQMMDEIDPRTARAFLPDFERVLGPDPCSRDIGGLTIEERQRLAHQRWTATGGQSIPYMISVAAKLGVTVTIDEFWPSRAGVLRAGQPLRPEGSQFVWRVNIPGLVTVVKFRTGISVAKHRLGSFQLSSIECELRRIKPAHTAIVFAYGAA
ncbi:MAG: putative phage tail protein [Rhizobium sp.]